MIQAVRAIVHENKNVEEAYQLFQSLKSDAVYRLEESGVRL